MASLMKFFGHHHSISDIVIEVCDVIDARVVKLAVPPDHNLNVDKIQATIQKALKGSGKSISFQTIERIDL